MLKMDEIQGPNVKTDLSETRDDGTGKRTRKLSLKGIALTMERLQKERNASLKQASKLKPQITTLLASKENVSVIQQNLKQFKTLCQNAMDHHNSLFTEFPLPQEEQRKQEACFDSKRADNDIFVQEISMWLKENGGL